jgi:ABC-2 type transport system permease protein
MINIMRADIYRIVRGKALYITLSVLLAVVLLNSAAGAGISTGINYDSVDLLQNADLDELENMELSDFLQRPTGAEAPFRAMASADSLLHIMIVLLYLIGSVDFVYGAAKNTLDSGVPRIVYYGSKLLLSCIACTLLFIVYILLSTAAATLVSGFGGMPDGFITDILKIFLPQLWLCLAVTCAGNFFVFLTRSGAFVGVFIAFLLAPPVVILMLTFLNEWFNNLFDYELTVSLGKLVHTSEHMAKTLLVGAGYIAASVIGGYLVFRRAEVK